MSLARLAGCLGALILSGLVTAAAAHAQAKALELKEVGDEVAVGVNATGEPCKIRLVRLSRFGLSWPWPASPTPRTRTSGLRSCWWAMAGR